MLYFKRFYSFNFVIDPKLRSVPVTEESLKVSFDILLGEIGGFVGMILGKYISHYKTIIFLINFS